MKKSKIIDFDPEALLDPAPSSSEDENSGFESEEEDTKTGREHYADVGKSKLRKKEVVPLGKAYSGSRVSRDAMEEEDSDDPFAREIDSEEDSEEDLVDGNGVAVGEESEGDEEAFDIEDADSDEEMGEDSNSDQSGSDEEDSEAESGSDDGSEASDDQAAKLRQMMKDTTLVASSLSAAAQVDVEKGKAIKQQRKTFDGFLNSRIRLQKALISTNSMLEPTTESPTPETAMEAAEAAALTLLNNLTNLRSSLDSARTGEKRKRSTPFTATTSSADIFAHIQSTEASALPHRNAILEKWSNKTRGAALSSTKGRLTSGAQQTLTDVLRSQLQDPTRLVARTQVPRSCAPIQSGKGMPASENIYDDADFYGLLLKQLLENRSSELGPNGGASEFVVQAPWQVAREAKTKKIVDTKASKGRKLRYTVHEKLQNYMAPEDRGSWGERQRDELFGGLFGRRVGLGEDEDVKSDDEEVDAAEEGLMLFRN